MLSDLLARSSLDRCRLFTFHDVRFALITAPRPSTSCEWFVHWDVYGTSDEHVHVETLSVTECMRLCEDEETCVSVAYHFGQNYCLLHSRHLHTFTTTTLNDGWCTHDHYCFEGTFLLVRLC